MEIPGCLISTIMHQSVHDSKPPIRHRERFRPRATDRHGSIRALDACLASFQIARRRNNRSKGQAQTRSLMARWAPAASVILPWQCLSKRAGIALVHVPYRGGAPALNDLIAGHVDFVIASTAVTLPQLRSGAIRPILQTGATRAPALPSVPTVIEGGFAGFEAYAWWACLRLQEHRRKSLIVRHRIREKLKG